MSIVSKVVQPVGEFAWDPPGAAARGGAADLESIFREHHPRILSMLSRMTGSREHAEDIAADVFCKFARRSPNLEGPELTAWIYRVATNAGLDSLRMAARRRRNEEAAGVEMMRAAGTKGALDGMLVEERRGRVRAVLGALKPRDAQILLLRSGGASYRELAEALGVAQGSVGTLLARAEAEFERRFRGRYGVGI